MKKYQQGNKQTITMPQIMIKLCSIDVTNWRSKSMFTLVYILQTLKFWPSYHQRNVYGRKLSFVYEYNQTYSKRTYNFRTDNRYTHIIEFVNMKICWLLIFLCLILIVFNYLKKGIKSPWKMTKMTPKNWYIQTKQARITYICYFLWN